MYDDTALSGIRVLEIGSMLSAPFASRMLGDLGADIVKLEPLEGDQMRSIGPMRNDEMGSIFLNNNRNKRSISVNLSDADGFKILSRLLAESDIFITNVRRKSLSRIGLTDNYLSSISPNIVAVFISGFSSEGPYEGRPAYDDLIQAKCGLTTLGAGDRGGHYAPVALADRVAGFNCAIAALSMLAARNAGRKGPWIKEIGMFEALTDFVMSDHLAGATFVPPIGGMGFKRYTDVRRVFPTLDGEISVMLHSDKHWSAFLHSQNDAGRLKDPRFETISARAANVQEVYAYLAQALASRSTDYWMETLNALDIPAERVNHLEDVLVDRHLSEISFFEEVDHPSEGRIRVANSALSRRSRGIPAPTLGGDTRRILNEIGYSESETGLLLERGVVR